MVTVKFTSMLRREIGREVDSAEAENIAELLEVMEQKYGDAFKKNLPHCHIFVNGSSAVDLDGDKTPLSDGDEVLFLIQVAGG